MSFANPVFLSRQSRESLERISGRLPGLLKMIQGLLQKRGQTLAAAESCSGGLLSFWLSSLPGASKHFKGAAVAYAAGAKAAMLGMDLETINSKGMVNEPCARSMARGARQALKADWGLSITGAAGPDPGSKGAPVGFVAFGLSSAAEENSCLKRFSGAGGREEIRLQSAFFALEFLASGLESRKTEKTP